MRRSARTELAGDVLLLSLSHKQTVLAPARSRDMPAYESSCCCAFYTISTASNSANEIRTHREARCAMSLSECRILQDVLDEQSLER